jgi:hypothetical protein
VRRLWPVVRITLVVALVAVTAQGGISDGKSTWREATSALEWTAVATQLLYGTLAVAVLFAMAFRRRWVEPLLYAWGAALTATGTLATVVWGGEGWGVAAVGGVSIAIVVALVVWAWRAHARSVAAAEGREGGR